MADLEQFRVDTRQWLEKNAPPEIRMPAASQDEICWGGRKASASYPAPVLRWIAVMAERGWTAPTWPKEYGGGGLSKQEAKILAEESAPSADTALQWYRSWGKAVPAHDFESVPGLHLLRRFPEENIKILEAEIPAGQRIELKHPAQT